jgi:hypothetical protein
MIPIFAKCPNCDLTHWVSRKKHRYAIVCSLCGFKQLLNNDWTMIIAVERGMGSGEDGVDVVWTLANTIHDGKTTIYGRGERRPRIITLNQLLPFDITREKLDQYILLV